MGYGGASQRTGHVIGARGAALAAKVVLVRALETSRAGTAIGAGEATLTLTGSQGVTAFGRDGIGRTVGTCLRTKVRLVSVGQADRACLSQEVMSRIT